MAEGSVRLEREGRVARLTIDRPAKKNALDVATWHSFHSALVEAMDDPGIHVALVTGSGGNFCAGNDLKQMRPQVSGETHPSGLVIELLGRFDKPLFAAVEGVAVGFGLTFLLHCDFVYVTPDARLRAPFVELGFVPEAGSTHLMPMRVGQARAAEIFFAAEFFDGERAVEIGLAQAAVPSEGLIEAAMARARQVAAHPLEALRETKRLLLATRAEGLYAAREREKSAFVALLGARAREPGTGSASGGAA